MLRQLIKMALVLVVIALAMPAHADRIEDLVNHHKKLMADRLSINEALLRTEGAIGELQRVMKIEADEKAAAEAPVVEAPAEVTE